MFHKTTFSFLTERACFLLILLAKHGEVNVSFGVRLEILQQQGSGIGGSGQVVINHRIVEQ